jgi:molybdenum cofactor biosynthesis enzyme MoaA
MVASALLARTTMEEMSIEIDTRCNARCFYCDTGNQSRSPHRKWMETSQFERILDHALTIGIIDGSTLVNLFDRGEPTLHPEFGSIVRALDRRALGYCISTNCGLVPRIDDHVSMAGLRKFVISMPGFSQASYDKIHRLPFAKVLQNIEFMLTDFKRRGSSAEAIMSLHVYRFNLDELAPAAEFCTKNRITFAPYFAFFNDAAWALEFLTGRLSDNVLARAKEELFLDKIIEQAGKSPPNFRCPQYDRLTINERGELVLCCGAPRRGDAYYEGYLLGDFLSMDADQVIRLKTTSKACATCIGAGVAYVGHHVMRPTEYLPPEPVQHIDSNVATLQDLLVKRSSRQWAATENASLISNGSAMRLSEDGSHGYHRLLGYIEDASAAAESLSISLLAKPAGCSKMKVEALEDGPQGRYVTATFDLDHGFHFNMVGPIAHVEISPSTEGFYRCCLEISKAGGCKIHYTVSLLMRDGGIIYSGDPDIAIMIKDLDIQ